MLDNNKKKLLKSFADQSDILLNLGIIRSDSFTGEIGEYIASIHFSFTKTNRVTKAVDGIDKKGFKYQVKAKVLESDKINYGIGNLKIDEIDYLTIIYFDSSYNVKRIIRIHISQLSNGNINISDKFLNTIKYDNYEANEIKIPSFCIDEILKFGQLYISLIKNNIVRSRRIVGDIGEFYASQILDLTLNENKNQKGVDAYDNKGIKYEIKTRRVYESERRISKIRRLNNLVGKHSEFLVVVALDRNFECAGMWIMPMKNINNPKSAHLQIVNTTPGVKNIVKSSIDWLI